MKKRVNIPVDFQRLCSDFQLETAPRDHKHWRDGWTAVECPFCSGNPGYHLGYNEEESYFNCWRCGWHPITEVISKLLRLSREQAARTISHYPAPLNLSREMSPKERFPFSLPLGCRSAPLSIHRRYLESRRFEVEELIRRWRLQFTGKVGSYKLRVIAPVYRNGTMVSFQGRDVTGRSPLRYKACAENHERVPHKACLYGEDEAVASAGRSHVVVCEGITDVWRIGPGAVATFGIEWTPEQARRLAQWQSVSVLFDSADPQAVRKQSQLARTLSVLGVREVEEIEIPGIADPAEIDPWDVPRLRKMLKLPKRPQNSL